MIGWDFTGFGGGGRYRLISLSYN